MNKNKIFLDPDKLSDKNSSSNKKLICYICKGIIVDPIELFCEHIFCNTCLKEWSEHSNN